MATKHSNWILRQISEHLKERNCSGRLRKELIPLWKLDILSSGLTVGILC